jgi:hypothetical protein
LDLGLREIAPGHEVARDPCCLSVEDFEKLGRWAFGVRWQNPGRGGDTALGGRWFKA